MNNTDDKTKSLSLFHPLIQKWFVERIGKPTDIQVKAWPEIALGKHVLLTAPTGSGKTLTAFLWSINQFLTGNLTLGHIQILYISPLKALNNDIQKNLLHPLSELHKYFQEAGEEFPVINILTRSGDTPQVERRRMLRRPPEILITTPESINIMLSTRTGKMLLGNVKTVILDEIHAIFDSKRGTHLITAIERLTLLSGEFQRIALSATVNPLKSVAEFIGGYKRILLGPEPMYEKRNVLIIQSSDVKKYNILVTTPEREDTSSADDSPSLVKEFKRIISENRSTLFFVNNRRLSERMALLINESESKEIAYSHHGSLSKEIRLAVEQRLKNGLIKAIVATSSLELGIDIGDLDKVVLIQSPHSISAAIQRIGRSGHRIGEESSGYIYPIHGLDFVHAAVIAKSIIEQDIEAIKPIMAPLDVLAQVILSMGITEEWDVDKLYDFIRTCYPYRDLSRKQYNLVLDMLAGQYADSRLRELRPRISIDRIDNVLRSRGGAAHLIFLSGGTIPDRGYYNLRIHDSKAKIGELDEEFVWERKVGETFPFGTQLWKIVAITHNDVEVVRGGMDQGIIPFWKAEAISRDFHFSEKIGYFLKNAADKLKNNTLKEELLAKHYMDSAAADKLISFLINQMRMTGSELPHRHHLLIEHVDKSFDSREVKQVIFHTLWGAMLNRPFALALSAAWENKYNYQLKVFVDNDCIILNLPHDFKSSDIFTLVNAENVQSLLKFQLEKTGFFGALFRENAGRALLLPRIHFNKRFPLWLNRLRSKQLFDLIMNYNDFPILFETWRSCLQDEFDLEHLELVLNELHNGTIKISEVKTSDPSPFTDNVIYRQTNQYMYEDDTPKLGKTTNLSQELLKEIAYSPHLRPKISNELIQVLDSKLKRTAENYAPNSSIDLLEWIKERMLIPEHEWKDLLAAIDRDYALKFNESFSDIASKVIWLMLPGASESLICAVENLPRIATGLHIYTDMSYEQFLDSIDIRLFNNHNDAYNKHEILKKILDQTEELYIKYKEINIHDILLQWLSYYGPINKDYVHRIFGFTYDLIDELVKELSEMNAVIVDIIRENSDIIEICDSENYERLLRMARIARRPSFNALDIEYLQLFLASFQGLTDKRDSHEGLQNCLEQLFCFPALPASWEEFILPARLNSYSNTWLDNLMQTSELIWLGCGKKKICFAFQSDLDFFIENKNFDDIESSDNGQVDAITTIIPNNRGKYTFFEIVNHSGLDSNAATKKLWELAWQGKITNDTFTSIRKGILSKFTSLPSDGNIGASHYNKWRSKLPVLGNWYILNKDIAAKDILDCEGLIKDRLRLLFQRYGMLFKEILDYELTPFKWAAVFRTLRLMELSGEILSGYFFKDISGLQFISYEAFRILNQPLPEHAVYWLNATDPISLCGIKNDKLKSIFPQRLLSSFLVFHGKNLVLIARKNGKNITFNTSHDDKYIQHYLLFFHELQKRDFNPILKFVVETINNEPAVKSAYADALVEFGFTKKYNGLELVKKY